VVSCDPVRSLKSTRSPPTFTVLEGLIPLNSLDRRLFGEESNTPHVRIDGMLHRLLTPEVLEGSLACEFGVFQTPGVGDIAFKVPARYFDPAVKLSAQESHLSVHDRGEWRSRSGTGVVEPCK